MATGASASDKMEANAVKEYEDFLKKVKRTVYIGNLSPKVTEPILRNALAQCGTVKSVQFVPQLTELANLPNGALVEMENPEEAETITVKVVSENLFKFSGIVGIVITRPAVSEMFVDHPAKPGRRSMMRWFDPNDPDFKGPMKAEEELARRSAALKANKEKHKLAVAASTEKTVKKLDGNYNKAAGSKD